MSGLVSATFRSPALTSIFVVGARTAGALIGLLTQLLLARIISAGDLGIFFLSLSLASVVSIFCAMGYQWLVPSIVSEAEGESRPEFLAHFLDWVRQEMAVMAVILIFVTVITLTLLAIPTLSYEIRISLILGAFTAPVMALMRLNGAVANAYRLFAFAYLPEFVLKAVLLLVLVLALWASPIGVNVPVLLAGNLLIVTGLTILQRRLLISAKAWATEGGGEAIAQDHGARRSQRLDWRRRALPMTVATLFIAVFSDLALLIVGFTLGSKETAIFGITIKIAMFIAFSIQIAHQIILREAADALRTGSHEALHLVVRKANGFNALTATAALIFTALLGDKILGVFGSTYTAGYACLVILVLAQVLRAFGGPTTQMLALTGHERAALPAFMTSLVALTLGSFVLVPLFGLIGAAVAVMLSTAVWVIWLGIIVSRRTGINVTMLRM